MNTEYTATGYRRVRERLFLALDQEMLFTPQVSSSLLI